MNRVLVVGYGNPLCGDDAIGPLVAHACATIPGVEILTVHQLTLDLAEAISQSKMVVFADAAIGTPGLVQSHRIGPDDSVADAGPFSHAVHPALLLSCTRLLYGHCPPAYIVAIGG